MATKGYYTLLRAPKLFGMCWLVFWGFLKFLHIGIGLVSFIESGCFFKSYFVFSPTTSDSYGTWHLALGLVGMHSSAASMWAVIKFFYLSFRYLLKSIKFISYSNRIFIAFISIGKWESVVMCGFDCFFFLYRLRYIFAETILWLEYTPSRGVCNTV